MWFYSHALLGTAIYGPHPAAILGGILPDTFSYLNWGNKFLTRQAGFTLMRKEREEFIAVIDKGKVWNLHLISHSLLFAAPLFLLTLYFYLHGEASLTIFFNCWLIHIGTDYFTHETLYPFFPWRKKFTWRRYLRYSPDNLKVELPLDFLFLLFTLLHLR